MSAWIVNKRHIDLLVTALFKYELVDQSDGTPDEIGQLLWAANFASVNYRRDEQDTMPAYTHESSSVQTLVGDHWLLLKQIHCLRYKSCEYPAWEASRANILLCRLEYAVEKNLPLEKDERGMRRYWKYNEAPWGIDDVDWPSPLSLKIQAIHAAVLRTLTSYDGAAQR